MAQDQWDISTGFAPDDVGALERDRFGDEPEPATVHTPSVPDRPVDPPAGIAEQAGLRRRTLSDVARDLRVAGDRVVLGVGGRNFTGVVTHAAGDLVSVETATGHVHANLRRIDFLRVAEPGAVEGVEHGNGPSSFKARLFELELAGTDVRVAVDGLADEVPAVIRAVGVDHVLLGGDEGEWVVPLAGVVQVSTLRP